MAKNLKKIPRHLLLCFLLVFMLYPVFMVVVNSLKTENELYANPMGFPAVANFDNYKDAVVDGQLGQAFLNSILITGISVVLIVILASMVAFALTRPKMALRKKFYALFLLGIMIPYQVGLYHLYRIVDGMGLVDTYPGMILIYVAYGMPFGVFVMFGFFSSIPKEINEAAVIDGCSQWQVYLRIVMPLSATVIATVVIFNLVWIWNDMLYPLIFIDNPAHNTLAKALLGFRGQFLSRYTVMFGGVVLASLPLIVAYLAMQKRFIAGMMAGSVKG